MPTYKFEQFSAEIVDPTIEKDGVFGYRFTKNVSGPFEGVVNLINAGGIIYSVPLSSPPEDGPDVLNQPLTDEQRATLIDAWIVVQLVQYIIP